MAKIPKNLTVSTQTPYQLLSKLSIAERLALLHTVSGKSYLDSLTPTEYALLFPSYYKKDQEKSTAGTSIQPTSGGVTNASYIPPEQPATTSPVDTNKPSPRPAQPKPSSVMKPAWQTKIDELSKKYEGIEQEKPPLEQSESSKGRTGPIDRSRFAAELRDPEVKRLFIQMMQAEVGHQGEKSIRNFTETVFNRAVYENKSLRELLSSRTYFQPHRNGRFDVAGRELKDEKILKRNTDILDYVQKGSNHTKGAAHNFDVNAITKDRLVSEYDADPNSIVEEGGEYSYRKRFARERVENLPRFKEEVPASINKDEQKKEKTPLSQSEIDELIKNKGVAPVISDPEQLAKLNMERPDYYQGHIYIEGVKYPVGSGKPGEKQSMPYGTFNIRPGTHKNSRYRSFQNNSFYVEDMLDVKLGRKRVGMLIHKQTHLDQLYSAGCFAVDRKHWPKFKAHLLDYMKRVGPIAITVDKNNIAYISPKDAADPRIALLTPEEIIKSREKLPPDIDPKVASETTEKLEKLGLKPEMVEYIKEKLAKMPDTARENFLKELNPEIVSELNASSGENPDEVKKDVDAKVEAVKEPNADLISKDPQKVDDTIGPRKDGSVNLGAVDDWLMSRYTGAGVRWKDEQSAKKYNMNLQDYVIRGIDPKIRMEMYEYGQKFEKETGKKFTVNTGFRDDYRQSLITSGVRARVGASQHGGSSARPKNEAAIIQYGQAMAAYGNGGAFDTNSDFTHWLNRNRRPDSGIAPTGLNIRNDPYHVSDRFSREARRLRMGGTEKERENFNKRYQEWLSKIKDPDVQAEIIKRLEDEGYSSPQNEKSKPVKERAIVSGIPKPEPAQPPAPGAPAQTQPTTPAGRAQPAAQAGGSPPPATPQSRVEQPPAQSPEAPAAQKNKIVYIGAGIKRSGSMYDERGILDRNSAREYYRRLGFKDENIRFLEGAGQSEQQRNSVINAVRENPDAELYLDGFSGGIGSMKNAWKKLSEDERRRVKSVTMSGGAYRGGFLANKNNFPGTKFINRPDIKGHYSHYEDYLKKLQEQQPKLIEPITPATTTQAPAQATAQTAQAQAPAQTAQAPAQAQAQAPAQTAQAQATAQTAQAQAPAQTAQAQATVPIQIPQDNSIVTTVPTESPQKLVYGGEVFNDSRPTKNETEGSKLQTKDDTTPIYNKEGDISALYNPDKEMLYHDPRSGKNVVEPKNRINTDQLYGKDIERTSNIKNEGDVNAINNAVDTVYSKIMGNIQNKIVNNNNLHEDMNSLANLTENIMQNPTMERFNARRQFKERSNLSRGNYYNFGQSNRI